ncbi:MAG: hypothetical protein ACKVZ0_03635 [Gemmatimonadales bacterium]
MEQHPGITAEQPRSGERRGGPLDIGEGFTEPGVTLFPTDPRRRAYLYWTDTVSLSRPRGVAIRDSGTAWRLPMPITIGTSMIELERLNGKPFPFSGFGWDYGGRAGGWDEGRLGSFLGPNLAFAAGFRERCPKSLAEHESREVYGDRIVSSSNRIARSLCPEVDEIWIEFRGEPPR